MRLKVCLLILFFSACSPRLSDQYHARYHYLSKICSLDCSQFRAHEEYFLVVLVDAKHLDYSTPSAYFTTLSQGLNPDIGHAWVVLKGQKDGVRWIFEGGHTGEFGLSAPKYFDEVRERSRRKESNPAQYLFSLLNDGQLEVGSGGHRPTFAAAFPLNKESFARVMRLFDDYDFSTWSLRGPHCVHFVLSCLSAIGIDLDCQEEVVLPQSFIFKGERIAMWSDPSFAKLTVETPELLEKRLIEQVEQKKAQLALRWYRMKS